MITFEIVSDPVISRTHLLERSDLIRILIACCMSNAQLVVIDVKNEIVLSHKGTAHHDFVTSSLGLGSDAISLVGASVQVLTWVPNEIKKFSIFVASKFERQCRERLEKLQRAILKPILVI